MGSVHPFRYNDFEALQRIVDERPVGTIVMEVMRNIPPADGFLSRVRELASSKGVVLIFDECTSGFRQTFGGLHIEYDIQPDMAVFGKALGNGYAITAVIGRQEVMEHATETFISSTFWTERIGPSAALKTLEVMERIRSWDQITAIGNTIRREWRLIAQSHDLELEIGGLPALSWFALPRANMPAYKTLLSQELLKQGILGANSVYTCIDHSPELIERYCAALDKVFGLIARCEDGLDVGVLLEGPVAQTGFVRLN